MSKEVGVWIDHKKAIIVSIAAGEVTTRTLTSDIGAHPHYSGSQEGGGEKKYEQRHTQDLDRYYDDVIGQIGKPDALLLFGPGEAKLQLKERLGRSKVWSESIVAVETTDKLTDPQIVAKVKEHYGIARWTGHITHTSPRRRYTALGNATVKVVPESVDELTWMCPPCADTITRDEQAQPNALWHAFRASASKRFEEMNPLKDTVCSAAGP